MQIIALVGPFGAGKSTVGMNLAAFLGEEGYLPSQVAIVVNEAGGATELATTNACVYTLPNGCFTCQDDALLRKSLGELAEGGTEVVIMEGFGIVSGDETKAFLSQVLFPYAIIGVLDVANWSRNQVNYGELLPTHLTAADSIVATKHDSEALPDVIQEFLGANQVRSDVTLALVDRFPKSIWPVVEAALAHRAAPHRHHHDNGRHHNHEHEDRHHGHDHKHDHRVHADHAHDHGDHDHSHGWTTVVLDLTPQTTLADLQAVTRAMVSAGKLRLKGRLHGSAFNVAPGATNWQLAPTELGDLVICYLAQEADWPVDLLSLVVSPPEPARAHQLLRMDTERSATVSAIKEDIATVRSWQPRTAPISDGRLQLVTHPERLQILKEMARRPGVKAEWFMPVMTACLEYWVKCAGWLDIHYAEVSGAHRPTHQRELGVSLAWWTLEFFADLPEDLVQRVYAIQPAVLVATGLSDVSALRADGFWRYWQGLEYLRGLRFGRERLSESDRAVVQVAAERVIAMAESEEERFAFEAEYKA